MDLSEDLGEHPQFQWDAHHVRWFLIAFWGDPAFSDTFNPVHQYPQD
jgi:hypothetical protein